jgi:hypothetical protein
MESVPDLLLLFGPSKYLFWNNGLFIKGKEFFSRDCLLIFTSAGIMTDSFLPKATKSEFHKLQMEDKKFVLHPICLKIVMYKPEGVRRQGKNHGYQ